MIRPGLFVAYGPRGRGVFTHQPIAEGDVVEVAPCVDLAGVQGMDEYVYWAPNPDLYRIVFGYGMLYAHSRRPNMNYIMGATAMTYYAIREIAAGDELTIDYGEDFWNSGNVIIGERNG